MTESKATVQERTKAVFKLIEELLEEEKPVAAVASTPRASTHSAAPLDTTFEEKLKKTIVTLCNALSLLNIPTLGLSKAECTTFAAHVKTGFASITVEELDRLIAVLSNNPLRYGLLRPMVKSFDEKLTRVEGDSKHRLVPGVSGQAVLNEVQALFTKLGIEMPTVGMAQSLFQWSVLYNRVQAVGNQLEFNIYPTSKGASHVEKTSYNDIFEALYNRHRGTTNELVTNAKKLPAQIFLALPLTLCDFVLIDTEAKVDCKALGRDDVRCFHLIVGLITYSGAESSHEKTLDVILKSKRKGVTVISTPLSDKSAAVCAFYSKLCSLFPDDPHLCFTALRSQYEESAKEIYSRVNDFLSIRPAHEPYPLGDCTQSTEPRQFRT